MDELTPEALREVADWLEAFKEGAWRKRPRASVVDDLRAWADELEDLNSKLRLTLGVAEEHARTVANLQGTIITLTGIYDGLPNPESTADTQ